ncbi:hypothetical protein I79_012976 [Cricetulus griseus]|uniref:Uncharacterized protein n=1 Tax=Cricetulus griseus TaxID=10029 RepID=G3HQ81_CRIGR|nr:hypothetical protein I79_012976 [Cricetulus griseus]
MLKSHLWLMVPVLFYQEGPPFTLTLLRPELRTSLHPWKGQSNRQQRFRLQVPHLTGRWLGLGTDSPAAFKTITRAPQATRRTTVRNSRGEQKDKLGTIKLYVQGFIA